MLVPSPRIAPLEPPYDADTEAALAKWMPPGSAVEPLRLFRTLSVHRELADRMRPLGAGILGRSAIVPALLREVMIHRTCALVGAEYEWGVHVAAFGKPLGFSNDQLASTVHGSWRDPCWDPAQASVFRLADELHETGKVSDEGWTELREHLNEPQVIELLVTAGWYHVIGFVCNGARVAREDWAPGFAQAASA